MEENNVQTGAGEAHQNFDGHPTQAHADHAAIMKAHGIISNPERMNAVHQLHGQGGGLIAYLKKKQKDFSAQGTQHAPGAAPAHEEMTAGDEDGDMAPNPTTTTGSKQAKVIA